MTENIYAVANQKGGVGKTTSAINLAAALATLSQRTLLMDLDPQANASAGSGVNPRTLTKTMADVLLGRADIADCIVQTDGKYDLLPANSSLAGVEMDLIDKPQREHILRNAVQKIAAQYKYILIDCPPALGILTLNGLTAAHHVIAPLQCEYYALEGLSALQDTIARVRATTNPSLRMEGILRTMYDSRNNLARDVSTELERHFPDVLFRTIVPRNVTLAEAPSHGQAAISYDKNSSGATAYLSLAREMRRRAGAREKGETATAEA